MACTGVLAACTSTTTIRSNPSGARIYLDDRPQGVTPYRLSETTWDWTKHKVRLEKEGSVPLEGEVSPHISPGRTIGWSVGTLLLIVPVVGFLSTVDYPEYTDFALKRDDAWWAAKAAQDEASKAKFLESCRAGPPGDSPTELRCYEATKEVEHLAKALKAAKSRPEQCAALMPVLTASLHPAEDTAKMGADSILIEQCRLQGQCLGQCRSAYEGCLNTPVQQHLLGEHTAGCKTNQVNCETRCGR